MNSSTARKSELFEQEGFRVLGLNFTKPIKKAAESDQEEKGGTGKGFNDSPGP